MDRVVLLYDARLTAYRFAADHPMRPERFSLAVELMQQWGLLGAPPPDATTLSRERGDAEVLECDEATAAQLQLYHTEAYVRFVERASADPSLAGHGIGPGDTPAFAGMHRAAALATGATLRAVEMVARGEALRAFSPAGGLHHAHADHASGFCVYNDVAVAIEHATRANPGLRVAYIDIDAHHGDGVEAAFAQRPDVLTLSVHESGRYLFPGTGRATDTGSGAGVGATIDVPLPPFADPSCYDLVFAEVIAPAVRAFGPDLLVTQIGGDSHRDDPLTHLHQSVEGFVRLFSAIVELAEEVCAGRVVATGGGGYQPFSAVPRMWAAAMAVLLGREVPRELPWEWRECASAAAVAAGFEAPTAALTFEELTPELTEAQLDTAMQATRHAIEQVRRSSPLLGGVR